VADTNSLSVNQAEFQPGESLVAQFTAAPGFPDNAWVGIIPSSVPHGSELTNDAHDIAYRYLNGDTSGTLTFTAPEQPGSYDLRMHDTDSGDDGVEVASVSFTVAD